MKKIIVPALVLLCFLVASHSCTSRNTDEHRGEPCKEFEAAAKERLRWINWLNERHDIVNIMLDARGKQASFETIKQDWRTTIMLYKVPDWARKFDSALLK